MKLWFIGRAATKSIRTSPGVNRKIGNLRSRVCGFPHTISCRCRLGKLLMKWDECVSMENWNELRFSEWFCDGEKGVGLGFPASRDSRKIINHFSHKTEGESINPDSEFTYKRNILETPTRSNRSGFTSLRHSPLMDLNSREGCKNYAKWPSSWKRSYHMNIKQENFRKYFGTKITSV